MPKKRGYEGSEWVGILVILGFFYVTYLALVKREKLPQVVFCSLILSAAFYIYVPELAGVFALDILVMAVYGGLLGYRTAKAAIGPSQAAPKTRRPVRPGDYTMVIVTISLVVSTSIGQSLYQAGTSPDVVLSSFTQSAPSVSMIGPNSYRISVSFNNTGSFSFKTAFTGVYTLDFMPFDTNSLPPYTVLLNYSIDGGKTVAENITIPPYQVGISSAIELSVNQTLSGTYAMLTQAKNPVNVELAGQVCLATETLSFTLTNNGNAKANAEVQITIDGKPASSLQLQSSWPDIFTPPQFQSAPAVFWYAVPPGSSANEHVNIGMENCASHAFNATVLQQLKE